MNRWAMIDEKCSRCEGHAEIIIPHKVKLCGHHYMEMTKNES